MNSLKIKINRKDRDIKYTIDLSKIKGRYHMQSAIMDSLLLAGYSKEFCNELFNIQLDKDIKSNIN